MWDEVKSIIRDISEVKHNRIQELFRSKGWEEERQIIKETTWAWDAYKDKVAVSVELSLIDALHRDFLRAILAQRRGTLDVLVEIVTTYKEPKFRNSKRDLKIFDEVMTFPVLLIGLKGEET